MARETKKQFTQEEKEAFIASNYKVTYWADKEMVKQFDAIIKIKNESRKENDQLFRKDAIIALMKKFVEKNKHLLEDVE